MLKPETGYVSALCLRLCRHKHKHRAEPCPTLGFNTNRLETINHYNNYNITITSPSPLSLSLLLKSGKNVASGQHVRLCVTPQERLVTPPSAASLLREDYSSLRHAIGCSIFPGIRLSSRLVLSVVLRLGKAHADPHSPSSLTSASLTLQHANVVALLMHPRTYHGTLYSPHAAHGGSASLSLSARRLWWWGWRGAGPLSSSAAAVRQFVLTCSSTRAIFITFYTRINSTVFYNALQ